MNDQPIVGYRVIDCDFNRLNYPDMIGRSFYPAPSYARVEPIYWRGLFA